MPNAHGFPSLPVPHGACASLGYDSIFVLQGQDFPGQGKLLSEGLPSLLEPKYVCLERKPNSRVGCKMPSVSPIAGI